MEELYQIIEEKIAASGYPNHIDGRKFYEAVSDEADTKEEGAYIFLLKWTDTVTIEGHMEVLSEQFDLHTIDIREGENSWHVDFDV